jgi:septal ring factor EnvC (AmiA/AmiB activator)
MLFVKGMEFRVKTGSPVLAVSGGKVVLNQNLPGYGRVIILDHGQRNYSLYARLAESAVSAGTLVNPGEKIAVLGDLDSKGKNFYFELRIKGQAVNPGVYLKKTK